MLMSCPPFAVAFVYGVLIAFISDYFRLRIITALPGMILTVIGFAMVYASNQVCRDAYTVNDALRWNHRALSWGLLASAGAFYLEYV